MKKKIASAFLAFLLVFTFILTGCSIEAESIALNESVELEVGGTFQLEWEVLPDDAIDKTVGFYSSDEEIAFVDEHGIVHGNRKGTAAITVSTQNGLESEVIVTVTLPVDRVTSEASLTLNVGETENVNACALPSDASDCTLVFTSGDVSVATVNPSGLVTAVSAGETTITITAHNGMEAKTKIIVGIPVAEVVLSETELYLYVNGTYSLSATLLPEDATFTQISWESSDPETAAVDAEGTVTTVKLGSTTITATAENGVSATCDVVVISPRNGSGRGGSGGSGSSGNEPGTGGGNSGGGEHGGDNGAAGIAGSENTPPPSAGITDAQIEQAMADARAYASSTYGFSIVGTAQPGHSIASTAYSDYNAFYQNLKDNVDYIASLFAGEDYSQVNMCIYRSGNSVYVTYG